MKILLRTAVRKRGIFIKISLTFGILILSGSVRIFSEEHISKPKQAELFSGTPYSPQIKKLEFFPTIPIHEIYLRALNNIRTYEKPAPAIVRRIKRYKFSTGIMGNGITSEKRLAEFLYKHNKTISPDSAGKIASLYIKEATSEGVNYDVAFAQMCLETGFLKFGGDVNKTQNNFCGLGVTGNGNKGLSFPSVQMGIRAHIQHLKAYASTEKLNNGIVDKRFKYVKRGSVKEITQLSGKWASDPLYGIKIKNLLKRLTGFIHKNNQEF